MYQEAFGALAASAQEGVFIVDAVGKLLDVNTAACALTGWERAGLLTLSLADLFPDGLPQVQPPTADVECRLQDANGRFHPVLVAAHPLANGRFLLLARPAANGQRAALATNAYLRYLLNTIPDIVWLKDTNGVYLAGNPTFERFIGCQEMEFIGKTDYDFFTREQADEFYRRDRQAIQAGKPTTHEEWVSHATDGRAILLETVTTPAYTDAGQLVGVLGIARDITEHKRVENALREQIALQTQLSQIAATVPGMICAFQMNPDGTTCMPYASAALDEIYGLQAEELAQDAAPLFAIIHPQDVSHVRDSIAFSARTMTQWHAEYRILHPRKGEKWIEGRSMPQRQPDGSILWHGFIQDVTERKRAEQAVYLLAETQRQISLIDDLAAVYDLVGSKVQELIGDGYTLVSAIDDDLQAMKIAGLFGFGPTYERLVQKFKVDPTRLTYSLADMTPEELAIYRSGRLEKFEDGLYALATGKIPRPICQAAERYLKIQAIYTMGFVWHNVHLGGIIILAKHDIRPYKETIETIVNQAAITIKRIKTEEGLRESEEKLRLFIEHAPAALAMLDQDMRYLAVSRRWLKDYHLGDQDILGQSHYDVFPEIPERWKAVHRRGLAGEVIRSEEDVFVRAENFVQWQRWEVRPWYTATGAIGGIVIFSEDISERKATERALQESQNILAAAESVAKIGSWRWDLDTQKVTWSDEMFTLFGVDRENFDGDLAQVISDCIHPDDVEAVNQSNLSVLQDHKPIPLEYRIVLPDGTQRTVWAEGRFMYAQDGRPQALVGYVQDITQRKQTESALKEMAENMAAAQQMTHSGSWEIRLTPDLMFVEPQMWSDECYRIFGLEPGSQEITSQFFYEHIHPEDRERAQQALRQAVQTGQETSYEYRLIRPNGRVRTLHDRAKVVIDERTQRPLKVVGIVQDITESIEAAATIVGLNRRVELILQSAGEGIYGLDLDGRITFVNPAMANMTGWEQEELLGLLAHDVFHHTYPDGRPFPAAECPIQISKKTGEMCQVDDDLYWRKDNTAFPIEYTSTPIRENDQIVGTVVVVKDITERKRAAAEQARLEEQLQQAQRLESIGRLAGGVAHDFNNQLTVIQIYGELLQAAMTDDDPLLPKLEQILQASEQAANLTRQLLALSRKQMLQPVILNLNDLIRNLQTMLSRLIGEDTIFSTALTPDLWPITVDPVQLEQVIMNLVVNARDAMPTGGIVSIETNNVLFDNAIAAHYLDLPPGPYVLLSVSDTGTGMDKTTQAHIFEPFFTTKKPGKGTGLGLATVHGIVKQSGGAIHVYSELGAGTTFKIYLPAEQNAILQPVVPHPPLITQHGDETILLVEDEDALRQLVRVTLEELGYTVLEAASGSEALALADNPQDQINLLLTDVVMPQQSGRKLAQELTAQRPDIKVLYMSGHTDDAVIRHGLLKAEVAFLPKPFTRNDLAAKIREVLDNSE